ncbi:hypothetical protein U2I54_16030 [Bacillus pseudomycoides]|uniref:Phage protein n=1 Tax=Bacillus bingmayongensis TaxID=1150157 RepID=A0ABU5JYM5_9BACI|nr:hypothetical protein [Bacillus pseudomycoides]
MLVGYKEQLLDKYELASVQALFNRNAQSDKITGLDDIYKRPESARDMEMKVQERKNVIEKIQRNESFFDQLEAAIRKQEEG